MENGEGVECLRGSKKPPLAAGGGGEALHLKNGVEPIRKTEKMIETNVRGGKGARGETDAVTFGKYEAGSWGNPPNTKEL